ncbi:MAG: hypothetical protein FJY86_01460 [Candidatus Diapherotrites archaeon]|uniref:Protein kinase domain-containing protein n=1 Tax=Candidatus Iainarchaeum sp. TaxID=3101447 RepID=A0A8T4C687_9ARCH|nr:hypothetical protein [Candidatus Diapherotrites archaeon]
MGSSSPRRKLVFPFRISTNKRGHRQKGTFAFLPRDVAVSPELLQRLSRENSSRRFGLRVSGKAASAVARERQRLAEQSDFFIKPVNARIRSIRERLTRANILVEKPIEDLKNNTELFRRGNYKEVVVPDSRGPHDYVFQVKNPEKFAQRMRELVTRIHLVGVAHNHLHMRNVLVTPAGKLQLIDLSKARLFQRPAKNKLDFLRRYGNDLYQVALALFMLRASSRGSTYTLEREKAYSLFVHELETLVRMHQKAGIPTFGVAPNDLINIHYSGGRFVS